MIGRYGKKLLVIVLAIAISVTGIVMLSGCEKDATTGCGWPTTLEPNTFSELSVYMADKYIFPSSEIENEKSITIWFPPYKSTAEYQNIAPINVLDKMQGVRWVQDYENLTLSALIELQAYALDFTAETATELVEKCVVGDIIIRQSVNKNKDEVNCTFNYDDVGYSISWSINESVNHGNSQLLTIAQKCLIGEQMRGYIATFKKIAER